MNKINKNYLDLLNNAQKEAVLHTEGSTLVLAGAGSGKTRVLIYKLLHLLSQKKAFPSQILAVTFTNKAALEMKNRVQKILNIELGRIWLGTFHSLSAKILRLNSELVNLNSNFIILDSDDQLKLIKQICENENIDTKEKSPKYYQSVIDNLKNKSIDPINYKAKNKDEKIISKIYNIYQKELIRLNCVDFGDLLLHTINIFKKDKKVLEKYQKQFKYILVDEYQDINNIQQIWLEYLYGYNKNICCVGDDDQSIYSWRGANVSNLLNFENNFQNTKIIRLEQNYRSSKTILKCASHLIKNNSGRYGKELWSNNSDGDKIIIRGFWETKEESIYISDQIEKLIRNKVEYNEIAILFRVIAHTRSFEERFINLGMPYKIVGGLRFYERKEIKDVVAYLRLVNNPNDNLAFERIINIPKRGIGKITINKLNKISRLHNVNMIDASEIFVNAEKGKNKTEITNFLYKLKKWQKLKDQLSHEELTQIILEDSKYIEFLEKEQNSINNPETLNRIDNIKEFIESLKEFENLEGFLEHVSLVMENISDTSGKNITLMTMHSAKGLEFDNTFLVGWEEGVFPSKRSIEELGKKGLEEERRLAYVALTRARKKIQITYVNQNRYSYASHDFNLPSSFINELPKDFVEIHDSNNFYSNDFIDEFVTDQRESDDIITPGRKRLLSNYKNQEMEWDLNQDFSDETDNIIGKKVFHQKYGYGEILNFDGNIAEIEFDKSSTKKIFLKYLKIIN